MVRLGDLGQIITGNTPKTTDAENYASKDIAFIKPSDIQEINLQCYQGQSSIFLNMQEKKQEFLFRDAFL